MIGYKMFTHLPIMYNSEKTDMDQCFDNENEIIRTTITVNIVLLISTVPRKHEY